METKIINGQEIAHKILDGLKKEVLGLDNKISLAVVSFGSDHSSYIKRKKETAEYLGVGFREYNFKESISTRVFRAELNKIVKENNSAVIVQLPLPEQIGQAVLDVIPTEKDPDVLSSKSVGAFFNNRSKVLPPTAQAIITMLEDSGEELEGKNIILFGHGQLVGRFLLKMLLDKKADVTVIASPTQDKKIERIAEGADIIISAVGKPHFLDPAILPKEAVVIDSGFSTLDGKISGDVDFEAHPDRFRLISPVPGGVGPVGIAILFKNIIKLAK